MSVRARQTAFGEVCRPLPYPQSARLFPRLACALNVRLFVHFVQGAQTPPVLALRGKNIVSKIVQICAIFCIRAGVIFTLIHFTERHHDCQTLSCR